ncbi:MAG: hypothetical protein NTY35_02160 [Planctomycetota bacterium]|nr:hypothetical protein [Planctomycetota bacterium]
MNALNRAVTAAFDAVLWPFERLGMGWSLILVSGIFGILALFLFKHVSAQKRIRYVKDRIKGHLIEIRIWQDDLAIVGKSTVKVLLRNFQYLGLNLLPFIPLSLPFVFVLAQLVVRYAYQPLELRAAKSALMAGQGTTLEVQLSDEAASRAGEIVVRIPDGLEAVSPLVRIPSEGRAFQELVARRSGEYEVVVEIPGLGSATKMVAAGDVSPRTLQPSRGSGFFDALLWPAEPTFESGSPFQKVAFTYPDRDLGWLPGGPGGIVLTFLVASMVFGALAIKPLRVTI